MFLESCTVSARITHAFGFDTLRELALPAEGGIGLGNEQQ
jgi:hypothetical protein